MLEWLIKHAAMLDTQDWVILGAQTTAIACMIFLAMYLFTRLVRPYYRRYRRGKLIMDNESMRAEKRAQKARRLKLKTWAAAKITDSFEDGYFKNEITRVELAYLYNFIGRACNMRGLLPQRVVPKLSHLDVEMLKLDLKEGQAKGKNKPVKLPDCKNTPRNKLQLIIRRRPAAQA